MEEMGGKKGEERKKGEKTKIVDEESGEKKVEELMKALSLSG